MKFIYVKVLCFLIFSACAEEKIYPDKYDLDFVWKQGQDFKWEVYNNINYDKVGYGWNSLGGKDGKGAFFIAESKSPKGGDSTLDLVAEMSQYITLYKEYEELNVGILRTTQNIDVAWLKVTCLGQNEDVLRKDSISIKNVSKNWEEVFLTIDLESTSYVIVSIYAHSLKNDEKDSQLNIDHISLSLDGKNINEVNHSNHNEVKLSPRNMIPLCTTDINNLRNIEMLSAKEHTFIGLGETFHGSLTLDRVRNQVIQNMVLHNNCKLILSEVPIEVAFEWNLFINGCDIDKEELREGLRGYAGSKDGLIERFDWLREYNANNPSQRVQVVGLDISMGGQQKISYLIHDYLSCLNKHKNEPILEELLHEYDTRKDRVYSFLEANQEELEKVMGDFEYKWFLNFFYINQNLSQIPGYMENGLWNSRDYFMWLNFECAVKIGLRNGEKAVLESHWGHINKVSVGKKTIRSLGYYINQHYGNKYKAIGLLGGEGSFYSSYDGVKFSNRSLNKPPIGSLEAAAMKSDIPFFFYPTSQLPSTTLLMRFNPQGFVYNQFIENSVKGRMDGMIFVRKCESGVP